MRTVYRCPECRGDVIIKETTCVFKLDLNKQGNDESMLGEEVVNYSEFNCYACRRVYFDLEELLWSAEEDSNA